MGNEASFGLTRNVEELCGNYENKVLSQVVSATYYLCCLVLMYAQNDVNATAITRQQYLEELENIQAAFSMKKTNAAAPVANFRGS